MGGRNARPGSRRRPPGASLAAGLAVALALAAPGAASAQQTQPLGPWDGSNPFNCQLQNVGTGTDFPDPGADPFCVEFDKTSQNLTDFGLVDFLANEPSRVAAASTKCFYFQRDHWTGSVVQGQPPELWHWDGNYFFDRARGVGGVSVRNFEVFDQPGDFTPFAPPQYQPFLDPNGGGGVIVLMESEIDPACAAKAAGGGVYNEPSFGNCVTPGGELHGSQVGHVRLGMSRDELRNLLGPPHAEHKGTDRWCVVGDGELRVAFGAGGGKQGAASDRATVILSTVLGHTVQGIRAGSKRRKAIRKLDLVRRFRAGGVGVFEAKPKPGRELFVGIGGKRVKWLAVSDPSTLRSLRATKRAVRRVAAG
jgi:hypothetical protein